jgi:hypothetical protein
MFACYTNWPNVQAESANYKTIIFNLEDEVKKLNRQQNLQLRINHHVKTKVSSTSKFVVVYLTFAVSASDNLLCIFH